MPRNTEIGSLGTQRNKKKKKKITSLCPKLQAPTLHGDITQTSKGCCRDHHKDNASVCIIYCLSLVVDSIDAVFLLLSLCAYSSCQNESFLPPWSHRRLCVPHSVLCCHQFISAILHLLSSLAVPHTYQTISRNRHTPRADPRSAPDLLQTHIVIWITLNPL